MIHRFLEQNSLGYVTDRTAGKGLKNKCREHRERRWGRFHDRELRSKISIAHDKNIFKGTFSTERTH